MGLIDLIRWLFGEETTSEEAIRKSGRTFGYVNWSDRSRTGKVRALWSDAEREETGWFGVDKKVMEDESISESARKVHEYLSRIADKEGYCFPFYKTVAQRCRISKSTVSRALNELEDIGLLSRTQRRSRRGGSSNIYRLEKRA